MKRTLALTTLLFLFSMLFIVGVCVAGNPVSKTMTADWTGTLYNVGVCPLDPSRILTVNVGNGVASGPLGSSRFLIVYCINPGDLTGYGWGIITTAKGDKLHLSISNLMVNTAVDPPEWSEEEEIVGGTGMFENASGGSFSQGTWTSGAAAFPGTSPGPSYPPPLLRPAQGWVGTTVGEITF
jgi:hypothetical protein